MPHYGTPQDPYTLLPNGVKGRESPDPQSQGHAPNPLKASVTIHEPRASQFRSSRHSLIGAGSYGPQKPMRLDKHQSWEEGEGESQVTHDFVTLPSDIKFQSSMDGPHLSVKNWNSHPKCETNHHFGASAHIDFDGLCMPRPSFNWMLFTLLEKPYELSFQQKLNTD